MRVENLVDKLERLAELLAEASKLATEIKESFEEMLEYAETPSGVTEDEFFDEDKFLDDFYNLEDYLDEGEP
jgi:hypothetical protein